MNTDGPEQTLKREGMRVADDEIVPFLSLDQHTPQHRDFPFHIVHLYRVQLDIYSESSWPEEILIIPWVTFAVFEAFLSEYGITKVERPLTELDKGSPIEQLFGMTDIDFIEDVLDNTQNDKKLRAMTRTIDPDPRAKWPLEVFYQRLCEWCYEVYDNRPHPALGQTPCEAYEASMLLSGVRFSRMIPYNETFRMLTLPMRGKAKVIPGRGVKVNHLFYWSDAFRSPEVENAAVPIGSDPADLSHVYAFVKGRWAQCL